MKPHPVQPGSAAMVAAQLLSDACRNDAEVWLDVYDRGAFIMHGRTLRQLQVERIAAVAVDLCEAVNLEIFNRETARKQKEESHA